MLKITYELSLSLYAAKLSFDIKNIHILSKREIDIDVLVVIQIACFIINFAIVCVIQIKRNTFLLSEKSHPISITFWKLCDEGMKQLNRITAVKA